MKVEDVELCWAPRVLMHGMIVVGGLLADPIKSFPRLFGEAAVFESQWIYQNPYALPSIINAILLAISTVLVYLFLEEVSYVSFESSFLFHN